jgi:hypothetical protein
MGIAAAGAGVLRVITLAGALIQMKLQKART